MEEKYYIRDSFDPYLPNWGAWLIDYNKETGLPQWTIDIKEASTFNLTEAVLLASEIKMNGWEAIIKPMN